MARGLVLPVLVALRDFAPEEQLVRDRGTEWRRDGGFWEARGYLRRHRCWDDKQLGMLLGHGEE